MTNYHSWGTRELIERIHELEQNYCPIVRFICYNTEEHDDGKPVEITRDAITLAESGNPYCEKCDSDMGYIKDN